MNLSELWSRLLPGEPTACAFAGEDLLLGDASGLLLRFGPDGDVLAERPLPAPIRDISASKDGALAAVACGDGEVALLEEDRILFLRSPGTFVGQVRLGTDASYLITMSRRGEGVFLNRYGREMRRLTAPDGARSLALIPATGQVLTLNRLGEVRAWSAWGKPLWEADIGPHARAIRSNDSGDLVIIPALSFGVAALTANGGSIGAYDVGEAVSEATCDSKGMRLLLATMKDRLVVMRRDATVAASESFSTSLSQTRISPDGTKALVTTGSGYVHLIALVESSSAPLLELGVSGGDGDTRRHLFRTRLFSPFMIMMPPRVGFSADNEFVVVAGGGGRATVLDMHGEAIDTREFPGSLLDLEVTDSGIVRVVSTEAVTGFTPGDRASTWDLETDLCHVAKRDDGSVLALCETGELYQLDRQGREMESLFKLPGDRIADLACTGETIVAAMKDGEIALYDRAGALLGLGGPWPTCPRILATSPFGVLCGVGRLLVLFGTDGSERWRHHQGVAFRDGIRVPGAFLVRDDSGVAHSVTEGGVVRRAFTLGQANLVPFVDSGEGPGFLRLDGHMVSAIHPDGRPRWRFRLPDVITHATTSADGRLAGVVSGLDFFVFGITRDASMRRTVAATTSYLEFPDG